MKNFSRIHFLTDDTGALSEFYTVLLGMAEVPDGVYGTFVYGPNSCKISFEKRDFPCYEARNDDFYWKIGITVKNLNSAVDFLKQQNWPVTEPRQFKDIGYLCHLCDPQGHVIELLQQGFEGREGAVPSGHPVGAHATLAHITMRVRDIATCRTYLEEDLKLRLMSVQPVPEYGFSLYFFSWNNESLPHPDLQAIENREWLWARPYPLLELQYFHAAKAIRKPDLNAAGFASLSYEDSEDKSGKSALTIDTSRLI